MVIHLDVILTEEEKDYFLRVLNVNLAAKMKIQNQAKRGVTILSNIFI